MPSHGDERQETGLRFHRGEMSPRPRFDDYNFDNLNQVTRIDLAETRL
jgi:hypothetical protein